MILCELCVICNMHITRTHNTVRNDIYIKHKVQWPEGTAYFLKVRVALEPAQVTSHLPASCLTRRFLRTAFCLIAARSVLMEASSALRVAISVLMVSVTVFVSFSMSSWMDSTSSSRSACWEKVGTAARATED